MSSSYDTLIHLIAGGAAGTIGAIATCPLEVIKTRLQSSERNHSKNLCVHLKTIIRNEGWGALFKGLGPNLIGNAPSRAIYFSTYSQIKSSLNYSIPKYTEHPLIHVTSAAGAGFVSCTATNPIWLIKTRLQLSKQSMSISQCVKSTYRASGIAGFYKGLTASYVGISETVMHFVIYEYLKAQIKKRRLSKTDCDNKFDQYIFFQYMMASAISKSCACVIAYPHEVARTRLREEGTRYKSFVQTIYSVLAEEGVVGLYRGLSIHLLRAIPYTAITMSTYELVVSLLNQEMFAL